LTGIDDAYGKLEGYDEQTRKQISEWVKDLTRKMPFHQYICSIEDGASAARVGIQGGEDYLIHQ